MQEFTIYHNTRCRKSRAGLQYLLDRGIKPTVVDYLKNNSFTEKDLEDIIKMLGIKAFDLVRTQEIEYKQIYKRKEFSEPEWIKILVKTPKLIRRPIIIKGKNAVIGDNLKHIEVLL